MSKDWTGNKASTFKTIGASNHTNHERETNDYYATDPRALVPLMKNETFSDILEPSCGEGHLSVALENVYNKNVKSSDLIDRGYGEVKDFFTYSQWGGDIITNPPYKYAQEFVEHSMEILQKGHKLALLLKLTFLEGQKRKEMFKKYPPKTIYVFSKRIKCAINGDFDKTGSSAVAYAWYVWEKGFDGNPTIKWI